MRELTKRQRQILDYISDYICDRGYPPTIREIGNAMGIKSTNGVSEHLETLWRKGYLIRDEKRANLARAMRPKHLPTTPQGSFMVPLLSLETGKTSPETGQLELRIKLTSEQKASVVNTLCVDRSLMGESRDVFAFKAADNSMIDRGIRAESHPYGEPGIRSA